MLLVIWKQRKKKDSITHVQKEVKRGSRTQHWWSVFYWEKKKRRFLLQRDNKNSGSYETPPTQSPVGNYLIIRHTLLRWEWLFLTHKNKADVGDFRSCICLWSVVMLLKKAKHEKKQKQMNIKTIVGNILPVYLVRWE